MSRRARPRGIALVIAGCFLASVACSPVGDESRSCSTSKGEQTLEAAGLGTDGLNIVEGCTEHYRGLREGELRVTVAQGDESAITNALGLGAIDLSQASSSSFEARTAPAAFDVAITPSGEQWQEGERRSYRHQIEYQGREWDRYVALGRQQGGDEYMVAVILETGSM